MFTNRFCINAEDYDDIVSRLTGLGYMMGEDYEVIIERSRTEKGKFRVTFAFSIDVNVHIIPYL